MNWLGEFFRRLQFRLRGARFDQELAEEIQLHLDLRAAEPLAGRLGASGAEALLHSERQRGQSRVTGEPLAGRLGASGAEALLHFERQHGQSGVTGEREAGGVPARESEAAARRRFGNEAQLREASREAWGWMQLDTLLQDIRYALRALAAHPAFTATAVLSLVLGIGANTAIFSIINAVILRSLPVEDPQELVQLRMGGNGELTNPIWEQVRDHQRALSGAFAYCPDRFDLADGGQSHFAEGLWVSGDFFRVLGVPASRGRVLTTEDDRRGGGVSGAVAVISYRFWKRNFQEDPNVMGRTLRLNRHSFKIVGVTPPWFAGLDADRSFDVAIPLASEPMLRPDRSALDHRSFWWLYILGRLRPGVSLRQAEDQMKAMAPEVFRATLPGDFPARVQKEYLENSFNLRSAATGFSKTGEQYRKALFTLMAIVGLVLLIACANIANLLLARAAARQRELSVRMAIGAGRLRVIRQLMTESLLLAALGAAGGLLLAFLGSRLLVRLISRTGSPLAIDLSPDLRVLAFTIAITALTALLFGLVPALRATRIGLNRVLKENARGALQGSTRFYLGKALVALQVALSLMLLVGAGLFAGTLRNLLSVDAGFNPRNVLLVSADVQQAAIPIAQRIRTYREILDRLRALPGVASAACSLITPISGRGWNGLIFVEGYAPQSRDDNLIFFNRVSPGYFRTMKTVLLTGRDFDDRDVLNSEKVTVIDESIARKFFGSENPIGKTVGIGGGPGKREIYRVIGVVKDAKYAKIDEAKRRTAYLVFGQDPKLEPLVNYEIRFNGPIEALIPSIRAAFSEVNGDISLVFRNLETQVSESLSQQRIVALLSSVFGLLALLLAMVGLYGVTAYAVARRRAEIGIRVALGAQRRSVVWLVVRGVVGMLVAGMSLGLAASLASGRLVTSLLYGVRPNDPVQLAGAALVLASATAIAAYLPARRAARIDPMTALREE